MIFLYHTIPPSMRGNILYPLNELRDHHPDRYRHELAKYDDHPQRRTLPETCIPPLGCKWNDVIHTAPIHPHLLYREWSRWRRTPPANQDFFQIPVDLVSTLPAAVMTGGGDDKRFRRLDWDTFRQLEAVPPETSSWYESLVRKGQFGAHFVGIPHILVKGTIDTSRCRVVSWETPDEHRV